MKKEIEWLECFKQNLEHDLNKLYPQYRKDIILWELSWINKRLEEL